METSSLTGKRVVILGGTSGFGLATAKAAAAAGAQVVIASSNQQRIQDALKTLPANAEGHVADLNQESNIQQLFTTIGAFDHLVYTAGENMSLLFIEDMDMEKARNFFNLRYWGALMAVKHAAPYIRPGGSINLTSGTASRRPRKGWAIATSICGAMEGLVRALAVELAPIRVNCVLPDVVRTNLWNGIPEADREQMYKSVGEALLVKRVGEPEDIAQAFIYLMQQQFGTGHSLVIDGGALLV
ncbi:SDR family oxidoreductase [Chitinophaga agrisoli]|uniref:SDR family oxidoreductase n=1 Tax=Chitinophaga agrisoli TaxID=2607653 RepID=A0A5B2VMK9_9BACT|nr:SDR family oxidoreductase [Chitinophaga agrisoli]KAA2240301.1 SDR family oxidoreductase [Chitinophaga agrisoli]